VNYAESTFFYDIENLKNLKKFDLVIARKYKHAA